MRAARQLTKYNDPSDEIGLGSDWEVLSQAVDRAGLDGELLLGIALATPDLAVYFDPGGQGAYFQSEAMVKKHLAQLCALEAIGNDRPDCLRALRHMLGSAALEGRGLYVTF